VYVGTLLIGIYVAPAVVASLHAPAGGTLAPDTGGRVVLGALALAVLVLVAMVRDGMWRGPVLLDPATVAWVLPLPVRRESLLRPRLVRALATAATLGAAGGAFGGVLLHLGTGGSLVGLTLAGTAAGLLLAVLAVAAGALVAGADGAGHALLRRAGGALWLLPALAAALAAGPVTPPAVRAALLWSGPWGWAVQPLAAAIAPDAATGTAWPVALVATVALTSAAVLHAWRRAAAVHNRVLRARAATVSDVAASVGTLQPRRARLLVEAAQGRRPHTRVRLPVPRSRRLLVAWRDATGLLRSPNRLLWGLIWLAFAVWPAAASVGRDPLPRFALVMASLLAGYLAAAQLMEGARLDADDPRTARGLPLSPARLALDHLIAPLAVLAAGLAAAVPVLALVAGPGRTAGLAPLATGLPALAAAAVVSAFRGDVPTSLLTTGSGGPAGDPGPVLVVGWYVRGPLVALLLLAPGVAGLLPGAPGVAVAAVGGWATTRARKVLG